MKTISRTPRRKVAARALAGGAAIALTVGMTACSGTSGDAGSEEVFDLTWTSYNPPESFLSQAEQEWIAIVEEETEGRVTVEEFYLGSLCPTLESLACAQDGRADIAYTSSGFYPAEFPLLNVTTVPFVTENPAAQATAITSLHQTNEDLQAEFAAQGVAPLYFAPVDGAVLGTKEPVSAAGELEGLSVRGTARVLNALDIAGSNAVAIPINEIYESVERGVIDGWSATSLSGGVIDYSLGEVTPYIADPGVGPFLINLAVINADVWESLPADVQEIMNSASERVFAKMLGEYSQESNDRTCDAVDEEGITLSVWSDANKKKLRDLVSDPLREGWATDAAGSGVEDPEAFYASYVEAIGEAEGIEYINPVEYCLDR
ncbi:TRAP transporter substrate-binding protein DctP [Microbacterium sp. A84]|uniref:TRAP transporter substrate-binding protein DctP n=1 Tax=Microbacterium sp. A84 TaxID=3450715 RepID=UPI003F4293AF